MDSMELYWAVTSHTFRILYLIIFAVFTVVFTRPFLENPKAARTAGIAYFSAMIFLYILPHTMEGTITSSIGCAMVCATMYILDRKNIRQKIILSLFLLLFDWIVHGVVLLFWDFMFEYWIMRIPEKPRLQFFIYIFAEFMYLILKCAGTFALIKITQRLYTDKTSPMSNQEFFFMLLPLLPCVASYYFFSYFSLIYEQDIGSPIWNTHHSYFWLIALYKLFCGGVILVIIAVIQVIRRQQKEEKETAVLAGRILDMENHIREVEKIYGDFRSLRHDMGNHMMTLENLYKKGEWKEARNYSEKVKKLLEKSPFSINSGNPVTDIILEEISRKAEENGILFESKFVFGTDTRIDTFDISVILSNALTNAIENADGEAPYIRILSYRKKNAFLIEVQNSFMGKIVFTEDKRLIQTKKADRQIHGYGLSNIRKTAEKYHGDFMIQTKDKEFVLTVLLMLE